MAEAEEIQPLTTLLQAHDAGLGRFGLQPEIGQQPRQRRQSLLGVRAAVTVEFRTFESMMGWCDDVAGDGRR
ncbi:MAG: hypothetical protein ACRD0K_04175 [Egibacteraceae bacterium]